MTSKDGERAGQTPGMVTDVTDLRAVRYEVADRIATVTLDRPRRLNAWTGRMHTE